MIVAAVFGVASRVSEIEVIERYVPTSRLHVPQILMQQGQTVGVALSTGGDQLETLSRDWQPCTEYLTQESGLHHNLAVVTVNVILQNISN